MKEGNGSSFVPFLLFVMSLACSYVGGNLFEEVKSCPVNAEEWKNRAQKKNCQEPIPDFICAAIENRPGKFGEICTMAGLSEPGFCAILDATTYNLNYIICNVSSGCPRFGYLSNELYKYPECYKTSYRESETTSTSEFFPGKQNTTGNPEKTKHVESVYVIAIPTFIVFLLIIPIVLMLWKKKMISKRKQSIDTENYSEDKKMLQDTENYSEDKKMLQGIDHELKALYTQKISILGAYMKFQLVKLSKVKNFRFHMDTHSKSLKLHFNENFDRMMYSSSVDWTKFDLDTVYTLLSNFCGITCPDREWGYRPTDEDLSVGADIERIRILVNEYLDHKKFKVDEADQILERWRWVKKEVDLHDIDFNHETKINYKKLKPNNDVEHGTVITRAVADIQEKLKSKKIVTCRGAIGCGKTTALKYVARKYRDDGWTIKWIEEFMDESFYISVIKPHSDKIIICCDNLFGSFGCQVFSDKMFDDLHFYMRMILKSENNIKVLLGIHEHVIEEIPSRHSLASQDYNVFVELNSLTQSEVLLIYMMQQEKANVKQEQIPFDDFLEMIENRSANVGTPFQTLLISAAPDDFGTKAFCNQPFQQLTELFSTLYSRDREMFYSLFYIMCVGIFDKREDELERGKANAIYPPLDKITIEYYLPDLPPYIQNDDDTVKIKHDVIAIALFYTYMMESNKPWTIFPACDIRGILELIRPENQRDKLHPFAVPLSRKTVDEVYVKTLLKNEIYHDEVDITGHPLCKHFSKH